MGVVECAVPVPLTRFAVSSPNAFPLARPLRHKQQLALQQTLLLARRPKVERHQSRQPPVPLPQLPNPVRSLVHLEQVRPLQPLRRKALVGQLQSVQHLLLLSPRQTLELRLLPQSLEKVHLQVLHVQATHL